MEEGHAAAFTLDGPRGPASVAQPGAVWLRRRPVTRSFRFTSKPSRTGRAKTGTGRRCPAVRRRRHRDRRALRRAAAADEAGREAACRELEARLSALEARAARPRGRSLTLGPLLDRGLQLRLPRTPEDHADLADAVHDRGIGARAQPRRRRRRAAARLSPAIRTLISSCAASARSSSAMTASVTPAPPMWTTGSSAAHGP